jgi:hypothetical protein
MPVQLTTVLITTIGVPFLVLVSDYINNSQGASLEETFLRAGPDLCLVGLGSSGSVFIDPKIIAAFDIPAPLVLIVVLITILIFRGLCRRLVSPPHSTLKAFGSCVCGIASIAIISCIIYYGYTRG